MIEGYKGDIGSAWGAGLAATNAMAVPGIRSTDNLLAVISMTAAHATPNGQPITDFTVGDGDITAGTVDLTGLIFYVVWTSVAAA